MTLTECTKFCKYCETNQPSSHFRSKYRSKKNGSMSYSSRCKTCENTSNIKRYRDKYKADGKHQINAYRYTLKTKYNLSEKQFTDMLNRQDNKCSICLGQLANPFLKTKGLRVNVDHCHTYGTVRNILCQMCNTGLGSFRDNTDLLDKAKLYLEGHKCDTSSISKQMGSSIRSQEYGVLPHSV